MPNKLPTRFNTWDDVVLALPVLARLEQQRIQSTAQTSGETSTSDQTQALAQGSTQDVALMSKDAPGRQFSRRFARFAAHKDWKASLNAYLAHINEAQFPGERERIRSLITEAQNPKRKTSINLQSPENAEQDYLKTLYHKLRRFLDYFCLCAEKAGINKSWLDAKKASMQPLLTRSDRDVNTFITALIDSVDLTTAQDLFKSILETTLNQMQSVKEGELSSSFFNSDDTQVALSVLQEHISHLESQNKITPAQLEVFFDALKLPRILQEIKAEIKTNATKKSMDWITFILLLTDALATKINLTKIDEAMSNALGAVKLSNQHKEAIMDAFKSHISMKKRWSSEPESLIDMSARLPALPTLTQWLLAWMPIILKLYHFDFINKAEEQKWLDAVATACNKSESGFKNVIVNKLLLTVGYNDSYVEIDKLIRTVDFLENCYKDIQNITDFYVIDQEQALVEYIVKHMPAKDCWQPFLETLYSGENLSRLLAKLNQYAQNEGQLIAAERAFLAQQLELIPVVSLFIQLFDYLRPSNNGSEGDSAEAKEHQRLQEAQQFSEKVNQLLWNGADSRTHALTAVINEFLIYFADKGLPAFLLKLLQNLTYPYHYHQDKARINAQRNSLIDRFKACDDQEKSIDVALLVETTQCINDFRQAGVTILNSSGGLNAFAFFIKYKELTVFEEHALQHHEEQQLIRSMSSSQSFSSESTSASSSTSDPMVLNDPDLTSLNLQNIEGKAPQQSARPRSMLQRLSGWFSSDTVGSFPPTSESTESGLSTSATETTSESTVEQGANGSDLSLSSSDGQPMDAEPSSPAAPSTSSNLGTQEESQDPASTESNPSVSTAIVVAVVEPAADKKRLIPVDQLPPVSSLKPHGRVWILCHYGRMASDSSSQSEFDRNHNFTFDESIASSDQVAQFKALPKDSPIPGEFSESFKRVIEHHSQNLASQQQDLLRAQVCRFFGVDENSGAAKAIVITPTVQQHYYVQNDKIYLRSTLSKIKLILPTGFSSNLPDDFENIELPAWINLTYVLDTREGFEENTGKITTREAYHLESCEIAETDNLQGQWINWLLTSYKAEDDTAVAREARRQLQVQQGFEAVLSAERSRIAEEIQRRAQQAARKPAVESSAQEAIEKLTPLLNSKNPPTFHDLVTKVCNALKSQGANRAAQKLDEALDNLVKYLFVIKDKLSQENFALTDRQLITLIGMIHRENNPLNLEDAIYWDGLAQCHAAGLKQLNKQLFLDQQLKANVNNRLVALACFGQAIKSGPFPQAYQDEVMMRRMMEKQLASREPQKDVWQAIKTLFKDKGYSKARLRALKREYVEMRYAVDIQKLKDNFINDNAKLETEVITYLADRMPPVQVETWLKKFFQTPYQEPTYSDEDLARLKDSLANYLAKDEFQDRRTPYEVALMKQVQHNYNQERHESKVFFEGSTRILLRAASPVPELEDNHSPAQIFVGLKPHAKRLSQELSQRVTAGKTCTPAFIDKLCKKDKAEGCVNYIFEQITSGECKLGWFTSLFGGEKIELEDKSTIVVTHCQKQIYKLIEEQRNLRKPVEPVAQEAMDVEQTTDQAQRPTKMSWPDVLKEIARFLKEAELRHTFSRRKKTDVFYGELRQEIENVDKQVADAGYKKATDAAARKVTVAEQRGSFFHQSTPYQSAFVFDGVSFVA